MIDQNADATQSRIIRANQAAAGRLRNFRQEKLSARQPWKMLERELAPRVLSFWVERVCVGSLYLICCCFRAMTIYLNHFCSQPMKPLWPRNYEVWSTLWSRAWFKKRLRLHDCWLSISRFLLILLMSDAMTWARDFLGRFVCCTVVYHPP